MNYNITFILVMLGIFFQITLQRTVLLLKIIKEYIQEVKLRFFCPFFLDNLTQNSWITAPVCGNSAKNIN